MEWEASKAEKDEKYERANKAEENQGEIEEEAAPKVLNKKRKAKQNLEETEKREGRDVEGKKTFKKRNLENITEFDWFLVEIYKKIWVLKSKNAYFKKKNRKN